MKHLWMGTLVSAVMLFSCDKDDDDSSLNGTDRNFMTMAAHGNRAEIEAGNLAVAKGNHVMVKNFGSMMVTDHSTSNTELKDIADDFDYDLPDEPDEAHQQQLATLSSLSGHMFDTVYINGQIRDHQKTIELFQNEITSGKDQQVKNYAIKYLPKIQHHKHLADSIRANL